MTQEIKFEAAEYGDEIVKFREKAVASANAATPLARKTFAGLLTGAVTVKTVTIAAIAAYKNPKTPKGKAVDKISGLRYAVGGDAARKTFESVFSIWEVIQSETPASEPVRALVVAFVLESTDCAKSLKALDDLVTAAIKAALPPMADEPEGEGEGQPEGERQPEAEPALKGYRDFKEVIEEITNMVQGERGLALFEADMQEALGKLHIALTEAARRNVAEAMAEAA